MNPADSVFRITRAAIDAAVDSACSKIAPTWPLDRFIAVNPYWGWVDRPFEEVASRLSRSAGSCMRMPRDFYRTAWDRASFSAEHVAQALAESGCPDHLGAAIEALHLPDETQAALPLLSDILDGRRDTTHEPAWRDAITHQISQFCAAYFDSEQADWRPATDIGLYAGWRAALARDRGIALLMNEKAVSHRARLLPDDPREAIAHALHQLAIPAANVEEFLEVILLRMNGWAAWSAYLRWQARLDGGDDSHIVALLAIRLAWECVLDDGARDEDSTWARWHGAWQKTSQQAPRNDRMQSPDYGAIAHRALEIAYQAALASALANASSVDRTVTPAVQAVFCIDVRSEVFRRALESAAPSVQTMGFAGFFGLPISYTPIGTTVERPQLPGLLAPSLQVVQSSGDRADDLALAQKRRDYLATCKSFQPFQRLPGSAFTLVEALGLGYLAKLIGRSLPSIGNADSPDREGLSGQHRMRPELVIEGGDALARKIALAKGILVAMGLTRDFARIVLLTGHGSQSANNPHAAGLDCGACCGQTGEVNARALAALLNEAAVRDALASFGIFIAQETYFLAALHNTTTDAVTLFDTDLIPAGHREDHLELVRILALAGVRARAERAPRLALAGLTGTPGALLHALQSRANDWAQTRPEWGLANNAAFIVAPRARSRGIDLAGRCFLHDYDWQGDGDGGILELIMTAPMVVAQWINMQYFASTVDNLRYGSGNKVLHNVVGGRKGVFEGNGGDLRIGLPMQSLHDGTDWIHTPLRLATYIEAPRASIEAVIGKHATVRQLVEHCWLFLFRIDPETSVVEAYVNGSWKVWAQPAG